MGQPGGTKTMVRGRQETGTAAQSNQGSGQLAVVKLQANATPAHRGMQAVETFATVFGCLLRNQS